MAQRVQYILEDDVDKSEAAETLSFGLDGVSYEIDLSADNAAKLREQLAYWIGYGRRKSGRRAPGRRPGGAGSTRRSNLAEIRQWARETGVKVSDRGRIPASVQEAYDKAHR